MKLFLLPLAFSVLMLHALHSSPSQGTPKIDLPNDYFVENIVQLINSPLVKLQENKVLFFADPNLIGTGAKTLATLLFAVGAGCLVFDNSMPHTSLSKEDVMLLKALGACGFILFTSYFGALAGSDFYNKFCKEPYIMLSNEGFYCGKNQFDGISFGHRLIQWSDIDAIEIQTTEITCEVGTINEYKTAIFKDKTGRIITTIVAGTPGMLPTSMENFQTLVTYFWNKNKDHIQLR